jgi:hypothetical protein
MNTNSKCRRGLMAEKKTYYVAEHFKENSSVGLETVYKCPNIFEKQE